MPLLSEGFYNHAVEDCVSRAIGRPWRITGIMPHQGGAMHDAARMCGDGMDVFVKVGVRPFSPDQFEQEAWGLDYLRIHSGIRTPQVLGVCMVGSHVLLVMEAIDTKPLLTKSDWQILGSGLAQLHRTTWDHCGLATHSYLGIFRQDNTPEDYWAAFYGQRRLRDSMQMVIRAGNMTPEAIDAVERLIEKLPQLCDPDEPFALLHGDPWIGNLLFDGRQLVLIDCSIYYGNREIDLTTVDLFRPVDPALFDAYQACYPTAPGFPSRIKLWRINQWLGHVTLYGEKSMPKLLEAVKTYL